MNKILILLLLAGTVSIAAFEGHRPGFKYSLPKNDGSPDDVVWVAHYGPDGSDARKKETYDIFLYSLQDTADYDDTHHYSKLLTTKRSLFIQLCVQASRCKIIDMDPFKRLVSKIKMRAIDISKTEIVLTRKDWCHRLGSYIPFGIYFCLVNDRRIMLEHVRDEAKIIAKCGWQEFDFARDSAHHEQVMAEFALLLAKAE